MATDQLYIRARKSGTLQCVNRGLVEFPMGICTMMEEKSISKDEKWSAVHIALHQ